MGGGSSKPYDYGKQLFSDTKTQTVEVAGSEKAGYTPIFRDRTCPDGFPGYLKSDEKEDLDTSWKIFTHANKAHGDRDYLGWRPFQGSPDKRGNYKFAKYKDVYVEARNLGLGLKSLGLKEESNVGVFSINRPEWITAHFAINSQAMRTVALYDTLGDEAISFIVGHAEIQAIFCEKSKLPGLFKAMKSTKEAQLKYVVQFNYQEKYANEHEKIDDKDVSAAKELGLELITYTDMIKKGVDTGETTSGVEAKPDQLAFIMYTSGTTGLPKGVMLSHKNFASVVAATVRRQELQAGEKHVSFLPLAHIFESALQTVMTYSGMTIAFFQGNIKKLTEDWLAIRPTIIIGVPRVFSKIYARVMSKVEEGNCIKSFIFNKALSDSSIAIRKGERVARWDKKIWKEVAKQVGFDECKVVLSGSAPLPPYLGEFLKIICIGATIIEGYGMTETTAVSFGQNANDLTVGNVGVPVDCCEFRLKDVEEMKYMTNDKPCPRGEILMRGPHITQGYFKNEGATKETIDGEGWLQTGDIGRINPNGTLSIIDRKKNIFKLAQGEYIAVEKVEGIYGKSTSVGQIWVYGNSFKSFVVAVVVPDAVWLCKQLQEAGLYPKQVKGAPASEEWNKEFKTHVEKHYSKAKELVFKEMKEVEKELKGFEKVKAIHLELELDNLLQGFNVVNNLTTPTFKLKRPNLINKYVDPVKQLYTDRGEPPQPNETWGNK